LTRAAKFIAFVLAALIFPAILGGAGEAQDGAPPALLEWPMLAGESLGQLAGLIYPGDVAMQKRFITAAVRENPATFSQTSPSHRFERETLIWLPDLKALSRYATSAKGSHHFLRPVLPAMQPSAAGAKPSRLQMSPEIENKAGVGIEQKPVVDGVALTPAPAIRNMNKTPVYDGDSLAAIEALIARNQSLQQTQHALEMRMASLEAAINRMREALNRNSRPPVQRIRRIVTAVKPPHEDTLLSPSPWHLLTALGILLVGGAVFLLRRRGRQPATLAARPPACNAGGDSCAGQSVGRSRWPGYGFWCTCGIVDPDRREFCRRFNFSG
jgi:LPXTG-motif cell wall-anchored protein